MKRVLLIALFLIVLSASMGTAGDTIKWSGEIRHRFEMDNKDFNRDTDYNYFNLLRTRLGAEFTPVNDVTAFIQVQDSRTFGEETSTLTDGSADNIDLHQAYFKIRDFAKLPVDIKIGRMEVAYGPQRLIGAVGWHNVGRSFDGVLFNLHTGKVSVDFFNFKQTDSLKVHDEGDQDLLGVYADLKLIPDQTLQAFVIHQLKHPSEDLSRYTAGIYAKGTFGGFHHETEFAYQGGTRNDIDVSALMFALNLGFAPVGVKGSPDVTVGVDYLSGDDDATDDTYKSFDTMYATNHKYYGYMDYFIDIPGATYGLGLQDIHVRISVKPCPKGLISLAFHNFTSAEDYTLSDGTTSNAFGNEIDLTVKRKYNDNVTFTLGASNFTPGDIFSDTMGGDDSTWFYLMTTVNF